MQPRLTKEIEILRKVYPSLQQDAGGWLLVPNYPLPEGWNRLSTDVAFQVPAGYPATPPYGIYVPAGIRFRDTAPSNYQEPAGNRPPFSGTWGVFSWSPGDGEWQVPPTDLIGRASLLTYVRGFAVRFAEGA